ncbi:MAG: 4Fe-4S binding protein [Myxococcales bacterium]|nr:4Fe-4S binding protein [Myxococcales bacterium]
MQRTLVIGLFAGIWAATGGAAAQYSTADAPTTLDCDLMPCAEVLPAAASFRRYRDTPFFEGIDAHDAPVGWVALSTSVVDIAAYSGKPLVTVVGLQPDGRIAGVRIIHHSEPILLTGIPEARLHEFAARYPGHLATERIVVGSSEDSGVTAVDVISGATVTALAANRTILETARALGVAAGVVAVSATSPGHFVVEEEPWSWARMVREGVFGRLTVTNAQMEQRGPGAFVDLWFTIADAPQIGRALLGDGMYEHAVADLEEGQHLFVILGNGSSSFKGSAFVRGGIFDRVRVDQGYVEIVFRDTDYRNLSSPRLPGAPTFREGAVFITRGGSLDPGQPYELVFLGSRYDGRGGFTRDFHEYRGTHRMPESVYVVDAPREAAVWEQAWWNRRYEVVALTLYLLLVIAVFVARKWTTGDGKRIQRLHVASMVIGFVGVGVLLRAQPSVTQVLTLVDALVHDWRWELFASEPLIFVLWIFIFVVSLVWGRGVFCGWVCPYGAMTELIRIVAKRFGVPEKEFPDRIHEKARYLRYAVLLGLVPLFLYDSVLGERFAEIEPFKSTFYVPFWTRGALFIAWWVALALWSAFTFRPFCRYLCPLGAGLALFNSFRFSGPRRRRFCSKCKICARGCEPKAFRPDGSIDARECLSCMDCEAKYRDEEVCPPLVGIARLTRKSRSATGEPDPARMEKLHEEARDA